MKLNKMGGGIAVVLAATLAVSALPFNSLSAYAEDKDITGNTMFTADEIKLGKVASGELLGGDNDWYTFTLTEPTKINMVIANQDNYQYQLIDEADDNKVLDSSGNGVIRDASMNKTYYLKAGTYYLRLYSESALIWTPSYDIKLTATPCGLNVPGDGSNNAIGEAAEIELETKYNAQISNNDDIDYFTFNLAKEGRVTFDFAGELGAVDWALYDNEDDLAKHGTYQKKDEKDSKITVKNSLVLKEGKYTLAVSKNEKASSYGPYSFTLNYLEKYNDTAVNGIIAFGDINHDGKIDAKDASATLSYYAYLSTGGTETDMNQWFVDTFGPFEK